MNWCSCFVTAGKRIATTFNSVGSAEIGPTSGTIPGAKSFKQNGRKSDLKLHPTVKPIAMVADAILDSTNLDDVVLDPFLGSGTTLLAAQRTSRRCYGVELDPLYVDTTIMRWERLTQQQARLTSGQSFADVKSDNPSLTSRARGVQIDLSA